jgi:ABC-2 type transport system ATP-binding protein
MAQPVIQTNALRKVFGRGKRRKVAVDHLMLTVAPQQVYGFLGRNGAGKTTTIRMLLTLMRPTAGELTILGEDPYRQPQVLRRVGTLVEGATFYPYLSGWDNLRVVGNSQGEFKPEAADRWLDVVGLSQAKKVKFRAYSTGMKQRLGIAAALMHDPELILLDEPTNGMDPAGIREMRRLIRDLAHQQGKTVFLTSHLLAEVQQTCDRLAIIEEGQLIREGKLTDLLSQRQQLDVEVDDLDKARNVLAEHWASTITTLDTPPTIVLRVEAGRDDAPMIVRCLVEAELDVYSVKPYQQTLEDYFLQEVGGGS